MKYIFIIFFGLSIQSSFAQKDSLRRNTISLESGLNYRGLLGLSYHHEFFFSKLVSFEIGVGVGFGTNTIKYAELDYLEEYNFLIHGGGLFKFGNKEFKPLIGFDLKGIQGFDAVHQMPSSNDYLEIPENTLSYNLYLGAGYKGPYGFVIKMTSGITTLPHYWKGQQNFKWGTKLSLGISLGYSF